MAGDGSNQSVLRTECTGGACCWRVGKSHPGNHTDWTDTDGAPLAGSP